MTEHHSLQLDHGLASAADEFLARLAAVDSPDTEALLAEFPEHAEELRRLLPAMLTLAAFGTSSEDRGRCDGVAVQPLGDFRLIREIGRGGMGVVYEANQLSLPRRVAIKILPLAAVLDDRSLQRFRHEAAAAAMLKHSHIVSIYSVGCDRGVYYYAMELIEGQTLAQVIEARIAAKSGARPSSAAETVHALHDSTVSPREYFRAVARVGIDAAEALEHAHQQGIVHRDIKPSNLLVDARGHIWVTDFGLAHIEAVPGVTLTGDLLGTLRYMSPEQAAGQSSYVDPRTDVYSLGATLYELATDRPVVQGQDRAEILREIAEMDPASPRKYAPAMPADLETVLLKCLAKEPSARYSTATALAEDLRRFLEQKPVLAKRAGMLDLFGKLARRHGHLLGVCCGAALVIAAMSVAMTFAILAERTELKAVNRDLRSVVDYYESRGEWTNSFDSQDATKLFSRFAEESNATENVKRALASAHLRLANAPYELAADNSPTKDFTLAVSLYERLVAEYPGSTSLKADLAMAHNAMGNHLYIDHGEYQDAFTHWRLSYLLWKECEGEKFWTEPSYLAFSVKIAESYALCPAPVEGGAEALEIAREWELHSPDSADVQMLVGAAQCAAHDWQNAKATLTRVSGSLFRGHPGLLLALAEAKLGEGDRASNHLEVAREWNEKSWSMFPRNPRLRWAKKGMDLHVATISRAIDEAAAVAGDIREHQATESSFNCVRVDGSSEDY
jgi:tetratricopeptide (TPR) repeat protein